MFRYDFQGFLDGNKKKKELIEIEIEVKHNGVFRLILFLHIVCVTYCLYFL